MFLESKDLFTEGMKIFKESKLDFFINVSLIKSGHGDELFLLFNLNPLLEVRPGTKDYEASRAMLKAWTDFAKADYG